MEDRKAEVEKLRLAVYASFLSSFCQGLELISRASDDESWDIDLGKCLQIWRAGCIIQSNYIADMLQPERHLGLWQLSLRTCFFLLQI